MTEHVSLTEQQVALIDEHKRRNADFVRDPSAYPEGPPPIDVSDLPPPR